MTDQIEQLQNDRNERLLKLDAEIAVLEKRTDSDPSKDKLISERRVRWTQIEQMYETAILNARASRDAETLAEKIRNNALADRQETESAKLAERFKFAAWKEFFKAGGTKAEFDAAWPELRAKLMAERIQNPQQPARRKSSTL